MSVKRSCYILGLKLATFETETFCSFRRGKRRVRGCFVQLKKFIFSTSYANLHSVLQLAINPVFHNSVSNDTSDVCAVSDFHFLVQQTFSLQP